MIAWWQLHEEDEKMKEKLVEVLKKIEVTEDELRISGVKTKVFDKILQRVKQFVKKPVGEMSRKQMEILIKLTFGQSTEVKPFFKGELKRRGVQYFDSSKYARWAKREKNEN